MLERGRVVDSAMEVLSIDVSGKPLVYECKACGWFYVHTGGCLGALSVRLCQGCGVHGSTTGHMAVFGGVIPVGYLAVNGGRVMERGNGVYGQSIYGLPFDSGRIT